MFCLLADSHIVLPFVPADVGGHITSAISALGVIVGVVFGGYCAFLVILFGLRWSRCSGGFMEAVGSFGPEKVSYSDADLKRFKSAIGYRAGRTRFLSNAFSNDDDPSAVWHLMSHDERAMWNRWGREHDGVGRGAKQDLDYSDPSDKIPY